MPTFQSLFRSLLAGAVFLSGAARSAEELGGQGATAVEQAEARHFKDFSESMLDGQWEGTLAMRLPLSPTHRQHPADPSDLALRVELQGQKARVYIRNQDNWQEAMPGQFVALRIFSNATVVGVQGDKAEGGWIESWSINLSSLDDTTLLAEWTRAVTNIEPLPNHLPAFSMAASGTLRRVN